MKSVSTRKLIYACGALLFLFALFIITRIGYDYYLDAQDRPLNDAETLVEIGRYREALPVIREYAERGNRSAKLTLWEMYAFGRGVSYDEERAAQLGKEIWPSKTNVAANEFYVAHEYLSGQYHQRKVERGMVWLKRAAASGNSEAEQLLANAEKLNAVIQQPSDSVEPLPEK